MSRKSDIEKQIKKLQGELEGLAPMETMGIRELGRAAGVSPTTALRAKRGEVLSKEVMKKMIPFMSECPCCGQPLDGIKKAEIDKNLRRRAN